MNLLFLMQLISILTSSIINPISSSHNLTTNNNVTNNTICYSYKNRFLDIENTKKISDIFEKSTNKTETCENTEVCGYLMQIRAKKRKDTIEIGCIDR